MNRTFFQICRDNGACILQKFLEMCMAYDSGIIICDLMVAVHAGTKPNYTWTGLLVTYITKIDLKK